MNLSNLLRENRSRELVWTIRTALGKLESQISRTPSLPEAYTTICNEAFDALRGLERLTMNLCDKHLEVQTMSVGPCPMCPAAPVPEGAQGKEPQFEDDGIFTDPFSETAYRAGEVAGRRSAITEIQEWILTVREDPFDLWSAGYNKGFDAVSKKCAELQEKTK